MAEAVYVMCAATSAICAFLLVRAFRKTRVKLLFWSALCFVALATSNAMVFLDLVVLPQTDLAPWRSLISLIGMGTLLFGLVWNTR